jgi:hypothetical protein
MFDMNPGLFWPFNENRDRAISKECYWSIILCAILSYDLSYWLLMASMESRTGDRLRDSLFSFETETQ